MQGVNFAKAFFVSNQAIQNYFGQIPAADMKVDMKNLYAIQRKGKLPKAIKFKLYLKLDNYF